MKVMMIGDVTGRPGRRVLEAHLDELKEAYGADFIIANLENASSGNGITQNNLKQMLKLPIDCVTMGNHVWGQRETIHYLDHYPMMLRPLNYQKTLPGRGYQFFEKDGVRICVLNLSGQNFMRNMDAPFPILREVLEEIDEKSDLFFVDFHAEATSEKIALGFYLDGRATAVVGTHTHVQTADERVLPGGCAYLTDLGMCGAQNSILGVKQDIILDQMLTGLPSRFEMELSKPWMINAAVIDADESTGCARSIERIYKIYQEG